ncbi:MAG: hypothetical protein V4751_05810 [Pseudomonadota bacterium]
MKQSLKAMTHTFATAALLGLGQVALAHTTLETSTMSEGVRVVNNVQIGHACSASKRVIATSVVFPDGVDSIITAGGQAHTGPLTDFVSNWGPNIQPLFTRAAFDEVDEKNGPTGNVVGLWAGGGPGMPNHMVAYVPFRVNATNIVPTSCATSVRFTVNIVDICNITKTADLHVEGPDGPSAEFWTQAGLGTPYDAPTAGAASLTITRNQATNPLPTSCGTGVAVTVSPSATQLIRDMPIKYKGMQVWPAL